MEILLTAGYIALIWFVFFYYKWLRFNVWWGVALVGFYAFCVLFEIICLAQYTPGSDKTVVEGYVIEIQSQFPGYVEKIYAQANVPLKKGDKVFEMDPESWQHKLDDAKANLTKAERYFYDAQKLTPSGAMAKEEYTIRKAEVDHYSALVGEAEYRLNNLITYAPKNGYIPSLQLQEGSYIGIMNKRVMPFVCTDDLWVIACVNQKAIQNVHAGDKVEVALGIYPGTILYGTVDTVVWAVGDTQLKASSVLPSESFITPAQSFAVKIKMDKDPKHPLRYGAGGITYIQTEKAPSIFKILRRLEIRIKSYLFYLIDPL